MKNKIHNPIALGEYNKKLNLKYPGVMTIIIYSFLVIAMIELFLAYFLYGKPTITYNFP